MTRRSAFHSRSPLGHDAALELRGTAGPFSWLNPTRARFSHSAGSQPQQRAEAESAAPAASSEKGARRSALDSAQLPSGLAFRWRSRDNRKGRHTLLVDEARPRATPTTSRGDAEAVVAPAATNSARAVAAGVWRMATVFPYWDVSWLIAVLFTVGCLIFIVCGLFYWLPLAYPATAFTGEDTVAGGALAFVGATLFQIGAALLVFEAVNENTKGCFGWALEQALTGGRLVDSTATPVPAQCQHHHQTGRVRDAQAKPNRRWKWWPSRHELRTHYVYEIGFWASMSMSVGATVFYVSGILSLPGVYDKLSPGVLDGVYWLTYIVGGAIFVISSVLYVLETQPNWYTPAPRVLGWHIGVWNLVGSVGWTLSAAFGYCPAEWCGYQSDLTLIWASMAFTIGSALRWYESLDKYPVIKVNDVSPASRMSPAKAALVQA